MILTLVDRLSGSGDRPAAFAGSPWEGLQRLAAPIGLSDWPVDLVLVPDETMADLNNQYRAVSGVTDVLSFSYLGSSGNGPCDLAGGEGRAAHDLWLDPAFVGPGVVGELVIAPGFVTDRCLSQGWSPALEFPWLVVHGCLHLVGWDHEQKAERLAMQNVEAELLAAEGLGHPLRQRS